jgi:Tfp pilus assembly protein PilV
MRFVPHKRTIRRRLGSEAGDTMIEVVVAALLVALIAAATFTGFSAVARLSGAQRYQLQANELAQQDEERLRGMNPTELSASEPSSTWCGTLAQAAVYGHACYTQTIDKMTFDVTTTSTFVSASGGAAACAAAKTGTADYIETDSVVTWANGTNDGRQPVAEHSIISPTAGGSLTVTVDNNATTPAPMSGVTVTVEGPGTSTSTVSLTTDANGCAVFAGLDGGNYAVTATETGYVPVNGVTTQNPELVAGTTQSLTFALQPAGEVSAAFETTINGVLEDPLAGGFDTYSVTNSSVVPTVQTFGTAGTYTTFPLTSTDTLYPSPGVNYAYAGTCSADDPGSTVDPTVIPAVPPAAAAPVTIPVPTMLLNLTTSYSRAASTTPVNDYPASSSSSYAGPAGSSLVYSGSGWNHITNQYGNYDNDETDSSHATDSVTFTFIGTSVQWWGSQSTNSGSASVSIDGGTPTTVNTSSAHPSNNPVDLYSSGTLPYQSHTIKITVLAGAPTGMISIDEFIIGITAQTTTTPVASSATTLPYAVTTYDSCGTPAGGFTRTPPAPVAQLVGSTWVFPVQAPYGTSVQVCFDNLSTGYNTGALPGSGAQISNTDLTGKTVTSLALSTTSTATGSAALFVNQDSVTPCPP